MKSGPVSTDLSQSPCNRWGRGAAWTAASVTLPGQVASPGAPAASDSFHLDLSVS